MGIFADVIGFIATPFTAAAGWAWDTVVMGITDWIMRGVLALLMAMWNFMDTASSPSLQSEWFYQVETSPFRTAMAIGMWMVMLLLLLAVIKAVSAGSPGAVIKAVGHDLPIAIFAMVSLVGFTSIAIQVADTISNYVWDQTREDALNAMESIGSVMMISGGNFFFAGPVLGIFMIVAMLFMWVVLFVRESLIYLVVIYAVAFGLPSMLFPPLRDTSKKVLELLLALIIAKPVMVLALSVGVSALGGVGATGEAGDGVGTNAAKELGTMVAGVVVFGLAAFMPFLVFKLMPIVAAAVVAQGISSGPMRAGMQTMQMQYYGKNVMNRLAGGGQQANTAGRAGASMANSTAASGGGGGALGAGLAGGGAGLATSGVAGAQMGAGAAAAAAGGASVAAAPAAGPVAPIVIAASATKAAADTVKSAVTSSAQGAATSGGSPPTTPPAPGSRRDVSGGS